MATKTSKKDDKATDKFTEDSDSDKKKVGHKTDVREADSKQDLVQAIVNSDSLRLPRKTMKSPNRVLKIIEETGETVESLALKSGVSEREILLAIRDCEDKETRKKIADTLSMTYYSVFGK